MRFATAAISCLALMSSLSQANAAQQHHKIKLPQSMASVIKTLEKPFSISQPLLASSATAAGNVTAGLLEPHPTVQTVAKATPLGFYPVQPAKDEGFNFTSLNRQLPDATRNTATLDTAGVMSWTAKFN